MISFTDSLPQSTSFNFPSPHICKRSVCTCLLFEGYIGTVAGRARNIWWIAINDDFDYTTILTCLHVLYTSINTAKPHYDVWIDDKAINIDDFSADI